MRLNKHGATDFAEVFRALLPPGAAWDWPQGGLGAQLLLGTAQELARVDSQAEPLLDAVVQLHRPKNQRWLLADYQQVAANSQTAQIERGLRLAFAVGSAAGTRLWSGAGASFARWLNGARAFAAGSSAGQRLWANVTEAKRKHEATGFAVPMQSIRACQPFGVGSAPGQRLWGAAARYTLQVRYYASVADVRGLMRDLLSFRQAHMFLWIEDVTGSGGFIDAQD